MGQGQKIVIGPLEMLFAGGDARYLKIGGIEVLRRIYVGVRDERWGTIPGVLSDVSVEQGGDRCRIRFACEHQRGEVHYAWTGTIEATASTMADGRAEAQVTFCMDGKAKSSFRTNRTGICVLHPIAHCAGRPVEIVHPDGSSERGEFPQLIAPHQPFTDIRTMTHEPVAGLRVEVEFEGEVFETEDQRNWSDGSYKTYCRPLSRGFPYELREGERVRQMVRVRVKSAAGALTGGTSRIAVHDSAGEGTGGTVGQSPTLGSARLAIENTISVGEEVGPLAEIGLGTASQWWETTTDDELALLRALNLSHIRFEVRRGRDQATVGLHSDADLLNIPHELAFMLPEHEAFKAIDDYASELETFRSLQAKAGMPDLNRLILYREQRAFVSGEDVQVVAERLWPREPTPIIGGGTTGNFTELNRNRPPAGSMPILSWPINPQVHAMDDLSLIENLQGQADTVRTARSFAPAAHLAVGPIILHRRPDPFAAGRSGAEAEKVLGDLRQRSQFGAAWTLVSIKRLAEAGADSLTYYETTGPYGVMDAGEVFPLYHVLKAIGEMKGAAVLSCTSSDELAFDALALRKGKRLRVMVACLKDEPAEVTIRHLPDGPRTLKLGPYEVVTLDYDGKDRIS